jgi:catechol 2,3-dioxygenase-like lactoylglutathione lyase family enzyme
MSSGSCDSRSQNSSFSFSTSFLLVYHLERELVLNWYRIDFVAIDKENKPDIQKEADLENKGAGIFLYFSVDNVDETYKEILSFGLKPSSEPQDMSWGNREFIIRDPDGYKIVLFKRKVAKNPTD